MPIDFKSQDDMSGSKFLDEPGVYHMMITQCDERPTKRGKQEPIDNAAFRLDLEVLAGTVPDQEGKSSDMIFFWPRSDQEEGKTNWSQKKIDMLAVALQIISKDDAHKNYQIDGNELAGRQIIVALEKDRTGKFLQMRFADVWHVDDPSAKSCPKNAKMLESIPEKFRKKNWPKKSAGNNKNVRDIPL